MRYFRFQKVGHANTYCTRTCDRLSSDQQPTTGCDDECNQRCRRWIWQTTAEQFMVFLSCFKITVAFTRRTVNPIQTALFRRLLNANSTWRLANTKINHSTLIPVIALSVHTTPTINNILNCNYFCILLILYVTTILIDWVQVKISTKTATWCKNHSWSTQQNTIFRIIQYQIYHSGVWTV